VLHAQPPLSPWSRLLLVERVLAGSPAAQVAAEMGTSGATAYEWLARYRVEGVAGLADRSSRPHRSPRRTDPVIEAAVVALRWHRRLGPARLAGMLQLNPSTVHHALYAPQRRDRRGALGTGPPGCRCGTRVQGVCGWTGR
jgi:hypothetical protein